MLKYLAIGVGCFLMYCFIYGHYNAKQAKKHREEMYKQIAKRDATLFWPQVDKSKAIVTHPKILPTQNKVIAAQPFVNFNEWAKWLVQTTQTAFLWTKEKYFIAELAFSKIEIRTSQSKSPFINLFSNNPIPKTKQKTIARQQQQSATKTVQQITQTKNFQQHTVAPTIVPLKVISRSETIEHSYPIPVVNSSSNNIEIYHSAPPVPRANMSYAIVRYDR